MGYYLLTVQQAGSTSYKQAADSKHHIEAASLDEAKWHADTIIDNHYRKADKATMRLLDETGVIATRQGDGDWQAA